MHKIMFINRNGYCKAFYQCMIEVCPNRHPNYRDVARSKYMWNTYAQFPCRYGPECCNPDCIDDHIYGHNPEQTIIKNKKIAEKKAIKATQIIAKSEAILADMVSSLDYKDTAKVLLASASVKLVKAMKALVFLAKMKILCIKNKNDTLLYNNDTLLDENETKSCIINAEIILMNATSAYNDANDNITKIMSNLALK